MEHCRPCANRGRHQGNLCVSPILSAQFSPITNHPSTSSSETSSNTNLTASQAATVHQKYLQPYAGTVQLGTPCITNGAGDLTLPYLESFLAACTTCTFNFVDVRFYQDRTAATPVQYAQAVRDFLENDIVAVQAKYPQVKGLPVFVSGWWLNGVTLSEGGDLMELLLPYLDNNHNVLAHQSSAGLLEGGLVNAEATGLTPAGQAYDNYFADVASFQG